MRKQSKKGGTKKREVGKWRPGKEAREMLFELIKNAGVLERHEKLLGAVAAVCAAFGNSDEDMPAAAAFGIEQLCQQMRQRLTEVAIELQAIYGCLVAP